MILTRKAILLSTACLTHDKIQHTANWQQGEQLTRSTLGKRQDTILQDFESLLQRSDLKKQQQQSIAAKFIKGK